MADKFVKMTKEGETIDVHPSVVEDHKRLGWKIVEEAQAEAKTDEEVKAEAKKKKAEAEAIVEAKGKK